LHHKFSQAYNDIVQQEERTITNTNIIAKVWKFHHFAAVVCQKCIVFHIAAQQYTCLYPGKISFVVQKKSLDAPPKSVVVLSNHSILVTDSNFQKYVLLKGTT
jgi:hypothetical protein